LVENSVDKARSFSVNSVNMASEFWVGAALTTAGTAGADTVGTTTSVLAGVFLGVAAFLGAGVAGVEAVATPGAAGVDSVFLAVFLSAGILFVLETDTEEDIFNALV
jgi:hypothetical protein